jgi:hypothetical protein
MLVLTQSREFPPMDRAIKLYKKYTFESITSTRQIKCWSQENVCIPHSVNTCTYFDSYIFDQYNDIYTMPRSWKADYTYINFD